MAVVQCKEITGRQGESQVTTRRRYTRVFQLLTSDPSDGVQEVRDWAGSAGPPAVMAVPAYGDEWQCLGDDGVTVIDTDPNAFCVEKRAVQQDENNFQNWMVYCEYVGIEDPTFDPPKVNWTSETYQETTQADANGVLVANSATDPYEHGITRDRHRRVLMLERSVLVWNPIDADLYIDTLNANVLLADQCPPGFAAGLCKIDAIDAEAVYYENFNPNDLANQVHYWRQKIKISIDPRGWQAIYLDAGYNQLLPRAVLTGTNLTVDATTNTYVKPDGYTPKLGDVGHTLVVTGGAGFTTGNYTIAAVVNVGGVLKWSLATSPAAAGTAGGTWSVSGLTSKPPIILDGGAKPSSPQLLNGAGQPLGPSGTPVYNYFTRYPSVDWTALALDY